MSLTAFTLALPCKAYIKKYFTALKGAPIALDHQSDFGITLLTMVSNKPLIRVNKRVLNLTEKDYDEHLVLQLPMDVFYRLEGMDLNTQQIFSINRYLENVFETDLCMTVAMASVFGIERKVSIERFAAKFGIALEEEVTYEALQKKEYRFRKDSTYKNMFVYQMASPFALCRA